MKSFSYSAISSGVIVPSLHLSASASMRACTAGSAPNSATRFATSGVKHYATGSSIFARPAVARSIARDTLASFSCVRRSDYHNKRGPVQSHAALGMAMQLCAARGQEGITGHGRSSMCASAACVWGNQKDMAMTR
jgi:hypothetical protein